MVGVHKTKLWAAPIPGPKAAAPGLSSFPDLLFFFFGGGGRDVAGDEMDEQWAKH